jgi:hypothetical protein
MAYDTNEDNFIFVDTVAQFEGSLGIKVTISAGIKSKNQLLRCFQERLRFPYFGMNWDALQDCLRDLSWLGEGEILIVHDDLPLLPPKDLKIYLSVLSDTVESWEAEPGKVFKVIFSRALRDRVLEVTASSWPAAQSLQEMMPTDSLPRRQLLEATERILGRSISITRLGQYLGAATFLADHLTDANNAAELRISVALESLEEIYAVALDRQWSELPSEEAAMAGAAFAEIARALGDVKEDGEQS